MERRRLWHGVYCEHSTYAIIEDNHSFYGQTPGVSGLWANAPTLEGCREELQSTSGLIQSRESQASAETMRGDRRRLHRFSEDVRQRNERDVNDARGHASSTDFEYAMGLKN